jgi:hypothetical protein
LKRPVTTRAALRPPRQRGDPPGRGGRSARLYARLFVYTVDFGIRGFLNEQLSIDLLMRFWRSHLLRLRRVCRYGEFCLDAREAAVMNRGERSIVGLNEDARPVAEPTYELVPEDADRVHQAQRRLSPDANLSGCSG